MLCAKYDYKMDIAVKQEEAFNDGQLKKAIEATINLLKMDVLTPEQISQAQDLPLEKVLELKEQITVKP